jgi:NmrA-like family
MITGLIIGAGRQSEAVIRLLSSTNRYHLLVFTRNTNSKQAVKLQALPNIELVANTAETGYDTAAFLSAASRSDFVFVNTDGFALGEQAETYWGIRLFELSSKANVKHLIYSGLDYNGKESSFEPKLYVGHYEGKARVQGMFSPLFCPETKGP